MLILVCFGVHIHSIAAFMELLSQDRSRTLVQLILIGRSFLVQVHCKRLFIVIMSSTHYTSQISPESRSHYGQVVATCTDEFDGAIGKRIALEI